MARKSNDQVQAEKEIAKFEVNYADKPSVRDRAAEHVKDMVNNCRMSRKSKEEEWLEDLRLWSCQLSDAAMYVGRSNLIIPEMHNQVETSVGQFMSGLFPNDDYIGVIPVKNTNRDEAMDIRDAVRHELDHKNNLPALTERFQRQKVLYGSAFFKPVFEKNMKTIVVKDERGFAKPVTVPQFQGVKVHCMDTFHTYVWPETAETVEDAQIIFDESFVPKYYLEKSKLYKNLDQVMDVSPTFMEYNWVDTVRMSINNLSTASNFRKNAVLLTECWCDFDIVSGERVPCVITIANYQTVVRVQRNPFWHQSKPYLMGRYIKGPAGEAYGHSLPERLRSLQYMITDIANQTMDSMAYSLNPIALIDPGMAGDVNSFKMGPGERWFASPQGVDFKTFPDISSAGFQGMQQMRGMIQQFSDNSPSIAPQLSGKVRSATQATAVQGEISANLRNMILADEFDVMGPLCAHTHWLLKQFQTEEMQIVTQGVEKGAWITKMVNPKTLNKDCQFVWRGSEVEQKTAIRNQQLISAMNMAIKVEGLKPGVIDLGSLYKTVVNESFGLKDLDIIIEDRQKRTADPKIENISLDGGEETPVLPGDNDDEHIAIHTKGYEKAEDADSKIVYLRHIEKHQMQKQAKLLLDQQQAKIEAMKQQMAGQGQEMGGGRRPGNPNSTPSSVDGMLKGMRGVEPNVGG